MLSENGIWYMPIHEIREAFTSRSYKRSQSSELKSFIQASLQKHDTAIYSDENYIGLLESLNSGVVYPQMAQKIRNFLSWAGSDCEVSIYVSIRNYANWIESSFLQLEDKYRVNSPKGIVQKTTHKIKSIMELLKDKDPEARFEKFLNQFDFNKFTWVKFLEQLRAAAPSCPITVWPFEAFTQDNEAIARVFESELKVDLPDRISVRKNPTDSELMSKILKVAKSEARPEDLMKLRNFLKRNFSTENGYGRRVLIKDEIRDQLTKSYQNDLQKIMEIKDPNLHRISFELAMKTS